MFIYIFIREDDGRENGSNNDAKRVEGHIPGSDMQYPLSGFYTCDRQSPQNEVNTYFLEPSVPKKTLISEKKSKADFQGLLSLLRDSYAY